MPRFLSAVRFLSSCWPTVRIHTCKTLCSSGARYAKYFPSGEIFGSTRSGLPKSTWRGMSGGSCAKACPTPTSETMTTVATSQCLVTGKPPFSAAVEQSSEGIEPVTHLEVLLEVFVLSKLDRFRFCRRRRRRAAQRSDVCGSHPEESSHVLAAQSQRISLCVAYGGVHLTEHGAADSLT